MQRRQDDYDEDYAPPPPRKKTGNEGLWIALGIAGLVGIIFFFIMTGSDSSENDAIAARAALRRFFEAAITERADVGEKLVLTREILRDQNPKMTKQWNSLSVKEQERLTAEAFRWVSGRVRQNLQIGTMAQVDVMLNAADIHPKPGESRVDFQWPYADEVWNAVMIQVGQDWLLERLDRRE